MQRSRTKQQALMFLLGAVLVGGVLGFSANRIMSKKPERVSARVQMYDDIGITPAQRVTMDSVLDETNCKTGDIMRSMRPAMDSIRATGFKTLLEMMTPEQRVAYSAREKRFKARMDSLEKAREAQRAKGSGGDRHRRCGGSSRPGMGPGGGPGSQGDRRGPGGPFV